MAHPFDDAPAAILHRDVPKTARALGADSTAWRLIHRGIVNSIDDYLEQILRPLLRFPDHPVKMAQFGMSASAPWSWFVRPAFRAEPARALFSGSAARANMSMRTAYEERNSKGRSMTRWVSLRDEFKRCVVVQVSTSVLPSHTSQPYNVPHPAPQK